MHKSKTVYQISFFMLISTFQCHCSTLLRNCYGTFAVNISKGLRPAFILTKVGIGYGRTHVQATPGTNTAATKSLFIPTTLEQHKKPFTNL